VCINHAILNITSFPRIFNKIPIEMKLQYYNSMLLLLSIVTWQQEKLRLQKATT